MNYRSKTKHKHKAKPSVVDQIRFPSKLEANCYALLKRYQEEGKILFFLRQIGFDLPGKNRHFVDFQVFGHNDSIFVEAKGRDLSAGKLKRTMCEDLYKVNIHVVKSATDLMKVCVKELF